jgi:hypothetical protein
MASINILRFKLEDSYSLIPNLSKTKDFLINDDLYIAYTEFLIADYRIYKIRQLNSKMELNKYFSKIIESAYLITYIVELAKLFPEPLNDIISQGNELIENVKSQLNDKELEEFNKYVPQKNKVLLPNFKIPNVRLYGFSYPTEEETTNAYIRKLTKDFSTYERSLNDNLRWYVNNKELNSTREHILNKITYLLSDYYSPVIDQVMEERTQQMTNDLDSWEQILKTDRNESAKNRGDLIIIDETNQTIYANATHSSEEEKNKLESEITTKRQEIDLKISTIEDSLEEEEQHINRVLNEETESFNKITEAYKALKLHYETIENDRKQQEKIKEEEEEEKQQQDKIAKIQQLKKQREERRNTTIETKL